MWLPGGYPIKTNVSRNNLLSREWCNLVFEGKNKDYGAYRLRSQAGRRYGVALMIVSGFILFWAVLFVGAGLYVQYKIKQAMTDATVFSEIKLPEAEKGHELKEVAAGRSAVALRATKPGSTMAAPEIVENPPAAKPIGHDGLVELSDAEAIELAAIADASAEWNDADSVVAGPPLTPMELVEVMPRFPGGLGALMKWLDKHVVYPEVCVRRGVKGRVEVSFTVETDGSIRDAVVTRKADPLLDRACLIAVCRMPKWEPGRDKGREVRVRVTLPVEFDTD